jgi:hypothetical protein
MWLGSNQMHQESTRTLCVTTLRVRLTAEGEEVEEHFIRLLDDQTFEVPARLRFDAAARCIASCLPPLDPMQNAPSCVVHSVLSCA